jgi:hypothetical protein
MKTKISRFPALSLAVAAMLVALHAQLTTVLGQGTAFSFQGKLNVGTNAANGIYDLRFAIYDSTNLPGTLIAGPLMNTATPVSNGLFTVTLDFGAGVFTGPARWLDIAVKTNGGPSYSALAPRQALTPTPYAIFASGAGAANAAAVAATVSPGSISTSSLQDGAVTSAKIGGGNVVKTLNLLKDDITLTAGDNVTLAPNGQTLTLASPTDWHVGGNAGTTPGVNFLGTTDNQPLEFKVNGLRALRLEPGTSWWGWPNVIGGAANNSIGASGSTIAGGHDNSIEVGADRSFIGGGFNNTIRSNAWNAIIAGGNYNIIETNAYYAVIGGGFVNTNHAWTVSSVIGGGSWNSIEPWSFNSVLAGGMYNRITGGANYATIPGGYSNVVAGYYSFAAGQRAQALHAGSFVWADNSALTPFASTANNQFLIRAQGGVGIGGAPTNALLDIKGNVRINDNDLYLRANEGDPSHGLGWYNDNLKPFGAATNLDGPVLYGLSAGALGTIGWLTPGGTNVALYWNYAGRVGIGTTTPQSALDVNGTVTATGFSGSGAGLTGVAQLGSSQTFSGTVTFNPGSGAPFTVGNANLVPNLNADLLDGLSASAFWQLGGNGGTSAGTHFLGTTDNQPLELKVNGKRALRLEPSPGSSTEINIIGGSSANSIASGTMGATIGGGTNNVIGLNASRSVIGGGYKNQVADGASLAGILGGSNNRIGTNSYYAVIGGGDSNQMLGDATDGAIYGVIGGGRNNILEPYLWDAFIGGGIGNRIQYNAWRSVILGGIYNRIGTNSSWSGIAGGGYNTIERDSYSAAIGGGTQNFISTNAFMSVIAGGSNNLVLAGSSSASIAGGRSNTILTNSASSAIGGGYNNRAGGYFATVAGGGANTATNDYATVSGGAFNMATGNGSMVPGGYLNLAAGLYSFAAGQQAKALHPGTFVWADATAVDFSSTTSNQFLIRAAGGVGIGTNNPQGALHVVGSERVTGLLRLGSETNTASGPSYPVGSGGLLIRRISSISSTSNNIVARTDACILIRDGTPSGLTLIYDASLGRQNVTIMGLDKSGNNVNYKNTMISGSGRLYVLNDSQKVVHYDISFGNIYNNGHTCHVVLDRYDDGSTSDNFLVGTVTTTYNQ